MCACCLLQHMQPTGLSHIISQLVQSLALGPALLVLKVQLLRIFSHWPCGSALESRTLDFDLALSDLAIIVFLQVIASG